MSNGIRKYDPDPEWFDDAKQLDVRAVVGGPRIDLRKSNDDPEREGHGHSVQLTIGSEFTILSEKQCLDLIGILSKRIECADEFSGTGVTEEKTVKHDGSKTVEETSW